nr:MAG TPA: hypothetical protein [Caudoviricetes sp.]
MKCIRMRNGKSGTGYMELTNITKCDSFIRVIQIILLYLH